MADGSQMDEQVQHSLVRDGYAILPTRSMPVGLAETAQAQHSTSLLMVAIVVQVAPPAWVAIEQLPEIHRTVPSKAHGKHVLKATVQQTFKFVLLFRFHTTVCTTEWSTKSCQGRTWPR